MKANVAVGITQPGEHAIISVTSFSDAAPPTFEPIALVPLKPAGYAVIDLSDLPLVSQYKWRLTQYKSGYIYATCTTKKKGKTRTIYMHRLILGLTNGLQGDHEDDNGLNNRRSNLRPATRTQNQQRQRPHKNGTSRYKGVCRYKDNWRAQIRVKGRRVWLGDYRSEPEAAIAYDRACIKHFKRFARPNLAGEQNGL